MDIKQKSYLSLHFAVFLFGFTGILGAVIDLPAITLVWWRALITWIGLIPILYLTKELKLPRRKDFLTFFFIGILVAIHWICFYGAIKLSNSSVAMICLATIPVFTTICETLINKNKWNRSDIFHRHSDYSWNVAHCSEYFDSISTRFLVGIIASIFSAIFATLNKKHITKGTSMQITWIELFSVWCFISLFLPFYHYYNPTVAFLPSGDDSSSSQYSVPLSLLFWL
ncbi:MAG: DMT family transporter [Saprospiraceae bacterium]|nr:DMT family transporter [Saprospiraceae bacterium]